MGLRSQYYSDWAAGKDVSGHDGRPRPVERCTEPTSTGTHYLPCMRVATVIVADLDGATYAMCPDHAEKFRTTLDTLRESDPIDPRD